MSCSYSPAPYSFDLCHFHTSQSGICRNCCITLEMLKKSFPWHLSYFSAPYEICPEDYAVSMVWRRTPSGELAFNRCPPNATGLDTSNIYNLSVVFTACFLNAERSTADLFASSPLLLLPVFLYLKKLKSLRPILSVLRAQLP